MRILIVRHSIAEDRDVFASTGQADELRPLTQKGQEKARKAAVGIKKVVPILNRIISSPLVRAQQTAEILAQQYHLENIDSLEALSPAEDYKTVLSYLKTSSYHLETIALVGHEPDLGYLVTWLLTGQQGDWMPLKKNAACLLELNTHFEAEEGQLLWYLPPKQLRQLATQTS